MVAEYMDIAYASIDSDELLLGRLYVPAASIGHGIVMVHGGAWTSNDRTTAKVMCESLAERGMVVFSLDFRCGPSHAHPTASSDIAAGIRFFRSNSAKFGVDPDTIGLIGGSSGGHLAMYVGFQPDVEVHRQTSVMVMNSEIGARTCSAQVNYIVALWPVSDPYYRYQYAKRVGRNELVHAHDGYFRSTEAMIEASVINVLQDGRATHTPPVLIVQPGEDQNVPEEMTLKLLDALQAVDCAIDYQYMPGLPHAFAYAASQATNQCVRYVWNFIEGQLNSI